MRRGPVEATKPRAWVSWSSGKDSALALHEAKSTDNLDVVGLVTTINAGSSRVAMHDVRRSLLEAQADALQLPLHMVELPWPCPNDVYERQMSVALAEAQAVGVDTIVYGDLFLEDIRHYREQSLSDTGLAPWFPLWQRPTAQVAQDLLRLGVRAVVTCVDLQQAPRWLAGHWYDEDLLHRLPRGVDPCGENGEFHTFVTDGPGFGRSVEIVVGESVERDGFVFTDLAAR